MQGAASCLTTAFALSGCGGLVASERSSDDAGSPTLVDQARDAIAADAIIDSLPDGSPLGASNAVDGGHPATRPDASDASLGFHPTPCVDLQSDPQNCGSCGHSCLGGACTAATCQPVTLATILGSGWPWDLAVDSTSVYWTNNMDGTIMKVPLSGGAPVTLASGLQRPSQIAVDSTSVYWTSQFATVMKMGLDGGTPVTLASLPSSYQGTYGIALDSTTVYFTTGDGVASMPKNGGDVVTLASGEETPTAVAVDANSVYWTQPNTTGNSGPVMTVPLAGGAPMPVAPGPKTAADLAVDATGVYWLDGNGVNDEAPDGGSQMVGAASGYLVMAVDSSGAYCAGSQGKDQIVRLPLDGGPTTVVATGQNGTRNIAVDSVSVYWTIPQGGMVKRVAK